MLSPVARTRDSLEVIEDAAEDLEDEAPTRVVEHKRGFIRKRRLSNQGRQVMTKNDLARYKQIGASEDILNEGDEPVQFSRDSFMEHNVMDGESEMMSPVAKHHRRKSSLLRNTLFTEVQAIREEEQNQLASEEDESAPQLE